MRLSEVNVGMVKMLVFGLMAAFAGLATIARLAAGTPSAGFSGELDTIASCFIGGTSMLRVDTFWQQIIKGMILILAVYLDIVSSGNKQS